MAKRRKGSKKGKGAAIAQKWRFENASRKTKRAAFARMDKEGKLYKRNKSGRRDKEKGREK